MKQHILVIASSLLISFPAFADKPEATGKEMMKAKAPAEAQAQIEEARATAEEKRLAAEEKRLEKEQKRLEAQEKRLEKEEQRLAKEKKRVKAEEMRKEMDKGSENGQAKRAEHSKKWWQFWK